MAKTTVTGVLRQMSVFAPICNTLRNGYCGNTFFVTVSAKAKQKQLLRSRNGCYGSTHYGGGFKPSFVGRNVTVPLLGVRGAAPVGGGRV
jgi:hypothetical protein